MLLIYMFYDHKDCELSNKMESLCRDIYNPNGDNAKDKINITRHDTNTSIDIINKVYKFGIKSYPSIVLSLDNYSVIYTGDVSFDEFNKFYIDVTEKHLIQNVDSVCSRLRSTISQAIWNNRSDYVEDANNAVNDIISLVLIQQEKIKTYENVKSKRTSSIKRECKVIKKANRDKHKKSRLSRLF